MIIYSVNILSICLSDMLQKTKGFVIFIWPLFLNFHFLNSFLAISQSFATYGCCHPCFCNNNFVVELIRSCAVDESRNGVGCREFGDTLSCYCQACAIYIHYDTQINKNKIRYNCLSLSNDTVQIRYNKVFTILNVHTVRIYILYTYFTDCLLLVKILYFIFYLRIINLQCCDTNGYYYSCFHVYITQIHVYREITVTHQL